MKHRRISILLAALVLVLLLPSYAGEIHEAVLKRDRPRVERVLKEDAGQVNARIFPDCQTALHLAVGIGDPAITERLLAAGADLSLADADSLTALTRAVMIVSDDVFATLRADIMLHMKRAVAIGSETPRLRSLRAAILEKVASMPAAERDARMAVLSVLLGAKPEVNKVFPDGGAPLHFAVAFGTEEVVKVVLEARANVNVRAKQWETPLHMAAVTDATGEMIQLLLERGAKIEALTIIGATPLMLAATEGSITAVESLMRNKARLDAEDNRGVPAIAYAAQSGKEDVIRSLLEKGGRALVRDARKDALFYSATAGGSKLLAEILLEEGVDFNIALNNDGVTPLMVAVIFERPDLARWLIEKGADPTIKTKSGQSLLYLACQPGNTELVKELIAAGANVQEGPNPLATAARFGRVETVEVLLAHGADVNAKGFEGMTPLHMATANPAGVLLQKRLKEVVTRSVPPEEDYAKVVELLLKHGAKVDILSNDGTAAVHAAAGHSGARVMRQLLEAGADPSLPTAKSKRGPLFFAAQSGRSETATVLLDADADAKAADNEGFTVLHEAATFGNAEVMKVLLAAGAPVDARDRDGATPLYCAAMSNSFECVRLLLDAGAAVNAQGGNGGPTPLVMALGAKGVIAEVKAMDAADQDRLLPPALNLRNRLRIVELLLQRGAVTNIFREPTARWWISRKTTRPPRWWSSSKVRLLTPEQPGEGVPMRIRAEDSPRRGVLRLLCWFALHEFHFAASARNRLPRRRSPNYFRQTSTSPVLMNRVLLAAFLLLLGHAAAWPDGYPFDPDSQRVTGPSLRLKLTPQQIQEVSATGTLTFSEAQLRLIRLHYPAATERTDVITATYNDNNEGLTPEDVYCLWVAPDEVAVTLNERHPKDKSPFASPTNNIFPTDAELKEVASRHIRLSHDGAIYFRGRLSHSHTRLRLSTTSHGSRCRSTNTRRTIVVSMSWCRRRGAAESCSRSRRSNTRRRRFFTPWLSMESPNQSTWEANGEAMVTYYSPSAGGNDLRLTTPQRRKVRSRGAHRHGNWIGRRTAISANDHRAL